MTRVTVSTCLCFTVNNAE